MQSNDLQRSTPEKQGIASSTIEDFLHAVEAKIKGIHSFILLRHGYIIAEGWWSPYQANYPHMLFSVSKSFTSTAVGIAIQEGYFSIDDSVLSFFPDDAPSEPHDNLKMMRVKHLLTMSTGHGGDTLADMNQREDGNWIQAFLEIAVEHQPGIHFFYNTGATYMLAAIVQKTTGMKLIDFLMPRLFEPLEIDRPTWGESPQGIALGGIGLSLKTEDLAKFGQLYLQNGVWNGQQIIPQAWINEATQSQISNGDYPDSDWTQGYGYQFWRCRHNAYRADGVFGQFCIVMPEQDAVLAMTGGIDTEQELLDIVWEQLLPAMQPASLADDTTAHNALKETLSNLVYPPVEGDTSSTLAAQISGRTYLADKNDLNIESIRLNFMESSCTLHVKVDNIEQIIPSGYGTCEQGDTSLFSHFWLFGSSKTLSSGAWISEDSFTMLIRLYETPFYNALVFHFMDNELLLEIQANVSLESLAPQVLTARSI